MISERHCYSSQDQRISTHKSFISVKQRMDYIVAKRGQGGHGLFCLVLVDVSQRCNEFMQKEQVITTL
jgi:hypothetical protein